MSYGYETASGTFLDLAYAMMLGDVSSSSWDADSDYYAFTEPVSRDITVSFRFTSISECDRVMALMDTDTENNETGTLYMGDWTLACNLSSWSFTERAGDMVVYSATFTTYGHRWERSTTLIFTKATSTGTGLDYPHDYPYDLGQPAIGQRVIDVDSYGPVDFRLIIYGEVTNPAVTIGGNLYEVDTTVPADSLLFINSTDKRTPGAEIYVRGNDGTITQAFSYRKQGIPGSGSYIFEKIQPGENLVTWDGTFDFDLELIEVRTKGPDDRY